jgi:hypothetical protein
MSTSELRADTSGVVTTDSRELFEVMRSPSLSSVVASEHGAYKYSG